MIAAAAAIAKITPPEAVEAPPTIICGVVMFPLVTLADGTLAGTIADETLAGGTIADVTLTGGTVAEEKLAGGATVGVVSGTCGLKVGWTVVPVNGQKVVNLVTVFSLVIVTTVKPVGTTAVLQVL